MLESRAVRRSIRRFARAVILLAFATNSGTLAAQQVRVPTARDTTSATLSTRSATDDHREMMARLGIKALRPGPSGNEQDPNHANYDEAKANPFTSLPDALTLKNGQKVTTRALWVHASIAALTHAGTGTVRTCPALPTRSMIAQ